MLAPTDPAWLAAYGDHTAKDLSRMRDFTRRIFEDIEKQYKALGDDRHVIIVSRIPFKTITPGAWPYVSIHFMREKEEGKVWQEATLTLHPRLQLIGKRKSVVFKATLEQIDNPSRIIEDHLRMNSSLAVSSTSNALFRHLKKTGFIEESGNEFTDEPFAQEDSPPEAPKKDIPLGKSFKAKAAHTVPAAAPKQPQPQALVIPYNEMSDADLEYIKIRASRIAHSLTAKYRNYGPNRFVLREFQMPREKIASGASPAMALHFQRINSDRDVIGEAFVECEFALTAWQNTRERQLVATVGIDSPNADKERVLSIVGKAATISRTIFNYVRNEGFLAHPFFDNKNRIEREFAKATHDQEEPPSNPEASFVVTDYKSEHIRFIQRAVSLLGRNMRNRYRERQPVFKDIDVSYSSDYRSLILKFKVNPHFKTLRSDFTITGDLTLIWSSHGQKDIALMFTPQVGLHLNSFPAEPFDICARMDSPHEDGKAENRMLIASQQIMNMILAAGFAKAGKNRSSKPAAKFQQAGEDDFEIDTLEQSDTKKPNTRRLQGIKFGRGDRPRRDLNSAFRNNMVGRWLDKPPVTPTSFPPATGMRTLSEMNNRAFAAIKDPCITCNEPTTTIPSEARITKNQPHKKPRQSHHKKPIRSRKIKTPLQPAP